METNLIPVDRERPASEALAKIERVVIEGDLGVLPPAERIAYYARVCESVGLNPLTRPFEYIKLNGKLTLYAKKDATDQLRKIHRVSVDGLVVETREDIYLVTASGHTPDGRMDTALGAVPVKGLTGEMLANAWMKAETKAKRRLTLALVGLGWLDESELGPEAQAVTVTEGGEVVDTPVNSARVRIQERAALLRGDVPAEAPPTASPPTAPSTSAAPEEVTDVEPETVSPAAAPAEAGSGAEAVGMPAAAPAPGPEPEESGGAPRPPARPGTPSAMRKYVATELGRDPAELWGLNDLTAEEWEWIWGKLSLTDPAEYRAWYESLKPAFRADLMAAGQTPSKREAGA